MTSMAKNTIEIIGNNTFNAVFDKGQYTTQEIHNSQKLSIKTHACILNPAATATNKAYDTSEFINNKKDDIIHVLPIKL